MFRRKHQIIQTAEVKSEPYDPRMFGPVTQTTNVNVTIEKDDGIAECLGNCFAACFKAGTKAAAN